MIPGRTWPAGEDCAGCRVGMLDIVFMRESKKSGEERVARHLMRWQFEMAVRDANTHKVGSFIRVQMI